MMAPKAREIDLNQVRDLLAQGQTQRQIAQHLQIPESTLRHRLKNGMTEVDQGPQEEAQGTPRRSSHVSTPEEHLGGPISLEGGHQGDQGRPPIRPPEGDLGRPSAQTFAHPPEGHQGIPRPLEGRPEGDQSRPLEGLPEGDVGRPSAQMIARPPVVHQGIPETALSPQLAADLTTAWPELQTLLAWWRARQPQGQDADAPARKLARQTYHVEQRYIEAVKREADRTGESYAAVVNRAFAQYFAGKET